jgi:hypothetical protein
MTDRDESKDIGLYDDGGVLEFCLWDAIADSCGYTRYVPHAQLLEAERKVAALEHMIERAGERLRFARVSLDQALLELNR